MSFQIKLISYHSQSFSDPVASVGPSFVEQVSAMASNELITWWHDNHILEKRELTPEEDRLVVRSPHFDVCAWVAGGTTPKQRSFTYFSWPRMGRQKWGYWKDDGAEKFDENCCTCSWSHCLYSTDIFLEVTIVGDEDYGDLADKVTLRPKSLVETSDGKFWKIENAGKNKFHIQIPYSEQGFRFSLEFDWEMFTLKHGWSEIADIPRNALIIFVEPISRQVKPEDFYLLEEREEKIHYLDPDRDFPLNLDTMIKSILYFRPGVYAMAWDYHAYLPNSVEWIYLAPGAYVKGAFQFRGEAGQTPSRLRITGAGTLSGEKYVYECDKENGFKTRPWHLPGGSYEGRCLKMLEFFSPENMSQSLEVCGITITNPPFHTFTVYGALDKADAKFASRMSHYHLVGAWYYQTDGVELPSWSTFCDSFIQSHDDGIKLYWSDVTVKNIICWFQGNGGVLQFGWKPRNLARVLCDNICVIHDLSRYKGASNCAIICQADLIIDSDKGTAHEYNIEDLNFRDIRVEGRCMCPIRLSMQSKVQNIRIQDFSVEVWDGSGDKCMLKNFGKNQQVSEHFEQMSGGKVFLDIVNFKIGSQMVTFSNATTVARMEVDPIFEGKWSLSTAETGAASSVAG